MPVRLLILKKGLQRTARPRPDVDKFEQAPHDVAPDEVCWQMMRDRVVRQERAAGAQVVRHGSHGHDGRGLDQLGEHAHGVFD